MSWLLVDIGNTQTVVGLTDTTSASASAGEFKLIERKRFRTRRHATEDEIKLLITQAFSETVLAQVSKVVLASVVPPMDQIFARAFSGLPFISVSAKIKCPVNPPLTYKIKSPEELGADRVANIVGTLASYEPPFVIVDAGTATTFCVVGPDRSYLGGAISPGIEIGLGALQTAAAKLFGVSLVEPPSVIGTTTKTQLQSGLVHGYEALVEGMVDRLVAQAEKDYPGFSSNLKFFGTGGCINFLKLSDRFLIDPDLTLKGLYQYGKSS